MELASADATDSIGRWRVIVTDSEGLTGVAPACPMQREPGGEHDTYGPDGDPPEQWTGDPAFDETGVYDCCPLPHLEVGNSSNARWIAHLLSAFHVTVCS